MNHASISQIIKANLKHDTITAGRSFIVCNSMVEAVYIWNLSNSVLYTLDFTQMMCKLNVNS